MLDQAEMARILDILGNRNRRRIIELLRQKPCFVTEISERLMLSPKAVIEHLQLMEREEILAFRLDDRRRKYYYLSHDIRVNVNVERLEALREESEGLGRLKGSLSTLRKLIGVREEMTESLRTIEQNIDVQIREIVQQSRGQLALDAEIDLLIALAHGNLTREELGELTGLPEPDLRTGLDDLRRKRIIEKEGQSFRLNDTHAR